MTLFKYWVTVSCLAVIVQTLLIVGLHKRVKDLEAIVYWGKRQ